jgi:hypothetical protein
LADQKKPPSDQDRLAKVERDLAYAQKQIAHMQSVGGFADAKTFGIRSKRLEDRVAVLERDVTMLLDITDRHMDLIEDHLRDRHDADLERDNSIDVVNYRKIRRRVREWSAAGRSTPTTVRAST